MSFLKTFIMVGLFAFIIPIESYADGGGTTVVILHPKPSKPVSGAQKSPADYSYLPIVWLSIDTIYFEGTVTLSSVAVAICDEDDNEVLSTTLFIEANEESTIDISTLDEGYYTLYIMVNDQEFYGEFEL